MIELPSGVLIFFRSKGLPKPIEGYIRDKRDPYVFHPDFRNCVHKTTVQRITRCGKLVTYNHCALLDITHLKPSTCARCEYAEEIPS